MTILLPAIGPGASAAERPPADWHDRVVNTARGYKTGLEKMIPIYEEDLRRLSAALDQLTDLYARGLVPRRDLEDRARLVAETRMRLESARREMVRADSIIAEVEMRKQLAALRPLRRREYDVGTALIRYNGATAWSLDMVSKVERFFSSRFRHALPISAYGQTPLHDRLGLDHRTAVDVALHPDSAEGQTLLRYLREMDVPFIAIRRAVAGSATGAHVHIGRPSERLVSPARSR